MTSIESTDGDHLRALVEQLLRFDTSGGTEQTAQAWLCDHLADLGFETYTWTADADALATHPSFPPASELAVAGRPSVAGVLELGDPDRGRTLILNGHMDIVPVTDEQWTGDPFEPRWDGDHLIARGAADMKSQLAACVVAARHVAEQPNDLNGRIVVESVAGEEDGGIGAAAAAFSNPYPFERDAALIAEPTDLRVVTATEGCLMGRVHIDGHPAHAARRWEGESVLPRFERVRRTFETLETDRAERVSHPLYDRFDVPWPIIIGRVEAGTWASNVPGTLTAEMRVGVAPGESLGAVAEECRQCLADCGVDERRLEFDRFGIQFEPAEITATESVVTSLQAAMTANGCTATAPIGETYGTDARHYVNAGVPTVVFGPGRIENAHFPDEAIYWPDVVTGVEVLVETIHRFLGT
jgi:acetylornithine deacetylase